MTHEMTAAAGPVLVDPPHIRLMALSGPMGDLARARQGLACLQALGFAVDNQAAIDRRWSRFAGTDAERLADLQGWTGTNMPAPDLLLATGLRRNGWLLAPLVAGMIADYLAGEDPGPHARRLDPQRFERP